MVQNNRELSVVGVFYVSRSGFLHTSLPYINFRLAISKVITFPITFSKFKSNFILGLGDIFNSSTFNSHCQLF